MNASEFGSRSSASRSDERDARAPTLRAPIVVETLGERWRASERCSSSCSRRLASIALAVVIANLPYAWFHRASISIARYAWTTLSGVEEPIVELGGRGPLGSSDRFIRSWGDAPSDLANETY
jgi:hypothetical protein